MTRRTLPLDGGDWELKGYLGIDAGVRAAGQPFATDAGWLPARVPGSVLDDLWRAGEIADPYVERNSLRAEWVPERAWLYRRRFRMEEPLLDEDRAFLRFDGVDHSGQVFLDGTRLGRHEGLFVPFELAVARDALAPGDHELAVVVEPAPDSEPQVGRTSRVRIHKPRMSYGWDFCPRLVHQGIWQPVALEVFDPVRIVDVWARPTVSTDGARGEVDITVALDAAAAGEVEILAELALHGRVVASATVAEAAVCGASELRLRLDVERPAVWWPNVLGEAAVHRLRIVVREAGGRLVDERTIPAGFRRIELAPNEGGPAGARPYTFVVNGRRVHVNGWNWVPADALYGVPRPERVEHLLHLAAAANVNLLRVWGGGLIETEEFYEACDRLGIMVWQEFSQSSSGIESTPSADPAFVELMRREAEAIVPLRRNHPSLAVWCGGNELENAGGGPLDEEQSPVLAALRDVVRRLDPERAWLPTSPTGPRFHNRLDVIAADPDGLHDVHGPWEHQGLAAHHELYDRGTSLFNSEFGVEGMANRRTHEALIRPEHRWPAGRDNAVYRHLGDWWNNEPLVQESFGGRLRDLDSLRRASQFLQAEGLRYAVEANRRRWPRNSGSIPWQLNESYPNAWCTSVVDHRGDPKPAYFAVKRAFAPTVVCAAFPSPALTGSHVLAFDVWAWSWAGVMTARWRVVGIDGSFDSETGEELDLVDGRPARVGLSQVLELPRPEALFFLDLRLDAASGTTLATNRYLLSGGSHFGPILDLAAATLDVDVAADGDAWRLEVCHRSGPAAIGVRLEDDRPITEPGWAEIDDGAFDLLPGEQRTVTVRWADAPARDRRLRLDAWNVAPIVVAA